MATSSLPGRITITVSTASGASCTIAALASGRVDQLHGAIERVLKIPTCVQNLIIACEGGSREIKSHELLSRLPLESCQNHHLTVFNSWPKDPEETVEKLKSASRSPTARTAAAVARCLTFEDSYVQAAALQALSWMGKAAKQHAPEIAEKVRMELPKRYRYGFRLPTAELRQQRAVAITAAVALSWLEEAGAAYAADILLYGWWNNSGRARDALMEMCQSESSATRLAAMKSLTSLLEKDGFGPVEHSELERRQILLPYICDAVFDESAEVHQVAGACLMRFVPSFSGEADIFAVRHTILDQLLRFGDNFRGKSFPESVSIFCRALAAKLDGYWPQFVGWQEGIDDEDSEAVTQVATAAVRYLRRRVQQWLADSQPPFGTIEQNESPLMDLIEDFEFGLASPRWQVRRATVESLIAIAPWGAHGAKCVHWMQMKEKRKEVLEVMASFLDKYKAYVEDSSTVRQCFLYLDYVDFYEEDYLDECEKEWTAQWEDSLMRDKHGGYLKSHSTRRARHNKQHGANASQGPSTIARKKKWERRSKPAEVQDYAEIKKISQRDKEQDRQLKAAMLGRELFSFSLGLERESS